ncbi:MAG: hypothetical protein A2520_10225 [Deltaproteobacteria bacterium RIFOXYD12_FULL_53_23]|nr:MAG: hypothetical protein A2520_10225 [Deltaproteobacteria bacterium RIFOXYD12_FULL_53_23]
MVVILVAIIPLLFISWTASHFYEKSWLNKTTVELTSLANSRREIIELFLNSQENILAGYAELYDFAWLSSPGNLEKLFKAMNQQGVIVDLGLIAQDGSHRNYVGPFADDLKDKNYAEARWFAEVMQSGRYISDVFTGYRGVPHFIVAVTDPTRSWVLRATINSELFNALLASAEVGPGGDAFILNRQGELQTPSRLGLTALSVREKDLPTDGSLTIHHSKGALYATTGMKNNAWTLVLKTNIATSLADFYRARQRDHLIIACAALLIFAVSTILVRSMMNKVEGADQQRMLLYDRIRYSEKMALIGRMAANVAHEINNPLQIIGDQAGWLDELLSEEDLGQLKNTDEYRTAFTKIRTQVKRASTITHRLLGFSRSTDGLKSAININTLVEETISFLEKEAANHRISIHRNLGLSLPEIITDSIQLQQVFLNILNNAFDAIGNDGAVTISISLNGRQLAVEFADSGPGLPEEILKKIFEPFFTTKKAGSGTGIGLAISYSIIERLGGSIEVQNGKQSGCVFRVSLPVAA